MQHASTEEHVDPGVCVLLPCTVFSISFLLIQVSILQLKGLPLLFSSCIVVAAYIAFERSIHSDHKQ